MSNLHQIQNKKGFISVTVSRIDSSSQKRREIHRDILNIPLFDVVTDIKKINIMKSSGISDNFNIVLYLFIEDLKKCFLDFKQLNTINEFIFNGLNYGIVRIQECCFINGDYSQVCIYGSKKDIGMKER